MPSGRWTVLWWARIRAGLSQQELADAVCASRQTISDIERGVALPSVGLALAIAARVGRTVEQLFDDSAREELVDARCVRVARRP